VPLCLLAAGFLAEQDLAMHIAAIGLPISRSTEHSAMV
jgi:hypothetical protein